MMMGKLDQALITDSKVMQQALHLRHHMERFSIETKFSPPTNISNNTK